MGQFFDDLLVCKACARKYDHKTTFGSTKSYCSARCRVLKGKNPRNIDPDYVPQGRPRRFPRQLPNDVEAARKKMAQMGWHVEPNEQPYSNIFTIVRGSWRIKALHDGTMQQIRESDAQVAIYIDLAGQFRIESTCDKGRQRRPTEFLDRRAPLSMKIPCGTCIKCISAKFLQQVKAQWENQNNPGLRVMNALSSPQFVARGHRAEAARRAQEASRQSPEAQDS